MNYFIVRHGHRIIPVEIGLMSVEDGGEMKECLMTMRDFMMTYIIPSSVQTAYPLCIGKKIIGKNIAYLAQHNIFNQIPSLLSDIDPLPNFCGDNGPSQINTWLGTGGTQTPLHFDTYDNLFVQLVGSKYVRLYGLEETSKLYVVNQNNASLHGKQGNMSAIGCDVERINLQRFPLAANAQYTEVLMLPGDCLFIPARVWHYVRSLTTSISVNFWW